ncbi:MAG: T9SS type B sorting domain-containing protein [Flavobacterium sp.]
MKIFRLLVLTVFFSTQINAQLAGFSLQVTTTSETCMGNGTLSFTTSNLTAGSTLLYKVYKMPNVTTPIAVMATGNFLGSLTAGTYKVVAIQALGSFSNDAQQEVTIANAIVPFDFNLVSPNQNCGTSANIIVQGTSGVPAMCEIISGPVTKPLQVSNIFSNMPNGTYNVRAFDACGMGKVKTFTLTTVNSVLTISEATLIEIPGLCDSITVSNTITPTSGVISYPLTAKHTLIPMNMSGESVIINQVINSGSPDSAEITAVVPRYVTDSYTYELRVTDNCNNVYEKLDNEVNPEIKLTLTAVDAKCGYKFITIAPSMHMAPYTVTFVSAPAGFDPLAFNATYQGPQTNPSLQFGSETNSVPLGNYTIQVTDACGRTKTESLVAELSELVPSAKGTNNGCFSLFGRIRISIPGQKVATAIIIAAPSTYTQPLPKVVTGNISNAGQLNLANLPLGVYTIVFTDDCGNTYQEDIEVPPYVEKNFNIAALPDCAANMGTVRFRSGNGDLNAASVTAAPASFGHALPYNVTSLINSAGDLYMNNLPEGTYTLKGSDICGVTKELTVNVEGYRAPVNAVTFTPNCGGFAVKVSDTSNGTEGGAYWLQKYNPATNTWGHPSSGTAYTEGTEPSTVNGIKLSNNVVKSNLNYTGKFRVLKKFEAFGNGTATNTICVSTIHEFEYRDGLSVSNAYSLSCVGQPGDVYIETTGFPTSYKIIKKNGVNFVINNGNNNLFTNLEPADYVFQVEDACGNIIPKQFSLRTLPSIAEASQPKDVVNCDGGGEFDLTSKDADVLGPLPSALYTITYHASQADADAGVNVLPDFYTPTADGKMIYARLVHTEIPICHGTTSFKLYRGVTPDPQITTEGKICNNNPVALTASAGYLSYTWSNGMTGRTIYVTEPGDYTVFVEKKYGNVVCPGFAEVTIQESATPKITKIETKDWSQSENSITIHATGTENILYSIDGINYQKENTFTNLETGKYEVYVKDELECGHDVKEVVLLYYPNFFTPNGDGVHDNWQIKYSILEPKMKVQIYDRYGKLITGFTGTSEGWDGTLNGSRLPSTDYWFVVTRADGREYKGHFAMIR